MTINFLKKIPKKYGFFLIIAICFISVSSVVYAQSLNKINNTVASKSSASKQTQESADNPQEQQSSNQSQESSNSSATSSSTSGEIKTSSQASQTAAVAVSKEVNLVGPGCNGPDIKSAGTNCKILNPQNEVGSLAFKITNSSRYMQKGLSNDSKQYIFESFQPEFSSYQVNVYGFTFTTQKVDFISNFSYNGLYLSGQSNVITKSSQGSCGDIALPAFWDYNCFYEIKQNGDLRTVLTDSEKKNIDRIRSEYLNFIKGVELYGIPNFIEEQGL